MRAASSGVDMGTMRNRSAALLLVLGLCSAGAQAGGGRVGFAVAVPISPMAPVAAPVSVVPGAAFAMVPAAPVFVAPVVPVHPVAPIVPVHPVAPAFGGVIVRPPHAPTLFPWVTTGFVPSPVVVTTTAPVTVNVAPPVAVFPASVVVPHVPVIVPSLPLFFAPPVHTVVAPPAGGPIIIIRGGGF
jgi:hypothetical protein